MHWSPSPTEPRLSDWVARHLVRKLNLNAARLNDNSYNLPKNQRSMDIEMWPGVGFPDI